MHNRNRIVWRSFDSLYKLSNAKKEISNNKNRYSMPQLSIDQQEELENNLNNAYFRGEIVELFFYHNYKYYKIIDKIVNIDKVNKRIRLANGKVIYLRQIIKIKEI